MLRKTPTLMASAIILVTIFVSFQNCSNPQSNELVTKSPTLPQMNDVYLNFPKGSTPRLRTEIRSEGPMRSCVGLEQAKNYCLSIKDNPNPTPVVVQFTDLDGAIRLSDCIQVVNDFAARNCQ